MAEIKKILNLRSKQKRKKPEFKRQEWFRTVMLGDKWRSPRGIDSKLRAGEKARGSLPGIGYRSPKEVRGLNPKGMKEVLVFNPKDLKKINSQKSIAVIGSTVGRKKKIEILKEAEKSGVNVSNFKL